MPDSESSSEVNITLHDKKGKIADQSDVKKSSETDMYFNLLANANKTVAEVSPHTDTSSIESDSSKSESVKSASASTYKSTSQKSKDKYEKMDFGTTFDKQNSVKHNSVKQNSVKHNSGPQLSPQETRMKKIELLRKLSEIKQRGFSLTKDYDFSSSLEEMEYEYELLRSFIDKRNGIKLYKSVLLNGASILEFLNDKYDPFDFHLGGWGEHLSVEVDSYDETLEELYEKYKGSGKKMAPEIKLILLLVASGSAYHFSKSQSSIPGLESVISKNPELISKLLNPQKPKSNFMSPQEISIEKQRAMLQQREKERKAQTQQNTQQPSMNNLFMNPPIMPSVTPNRTVIRAPDNVKDILSRIKGSASLAETTEDNSSNNDRIISDINLSDSKRGRKPKSMPSININTK